MRGHASVCVTSMEKTLGPLLKKQSKPKIPGNNCFDENEEKNGKPEKNSARGFSIKITIGFLCGVFEDALECPWLYLCKIMGILQKYFRVRPWTSWRQLFGRDAPNCDVVRLKSWKVKENLLDEFVPAGVAFVVEQSRPAEWVVVPLPPVTLAAKTWAAADLICWAGHVLMEGGVGMGISV